jgi:hypothetical protein
MESVDAQRITETARVATPRRLMMCQLFGLQFSSANHDGPARLLSGRAGLVFQSEEQAIRNCGTGTCFCLGDLPRGDTARLLSGGLPASLVFSSDPSLLHHSSY